jgi:glycosyltransferase involved in cell wall biosynthesis
LAVSSTPAFLIANARLRKQRFYTVVESGLGIIYNFIAVSFARLFGYQLFLHHHGSNYAKTYSRRFGALCALAGRSALHVALSESMARDLKVLYSVQTMVVHNACHIHDPGERPTRDPASPLTIGFLSNLSLEKGVDTVLLTVEAIHARGVNARLVIGGPIVDTQARDLIDEAYAKFGDSIVELGAISGTAKHEFFESLDLFLFPSRYRMEAQPLVILEALSYGVPALATPQGYSAELIEPLKTVAEASSFVSFASEFALRCAHDPDYAGRHRVAARARFLELLKNSKQQNALLLSMLTEL